MASHFKEDVEGVPAGLYAPVESHSGSGHGHHHGHRSGGGHGHRHGRGHTRRAVVAGGVCLAAVAAVGVATPAMADGLIDGLKEKASNVSSLLNQALSAFKELDFAKASELCADTSDAVGDFQAQLQGPLWDAAEMVPILGEDVKSARTLVGMLADLVDEALAPVSQTLAGIDLGSLMAVVGQGQIQVDVASIQAVSSAVKQALPALDESIATINGMGEMHISQLAQVVSMAKEKIAPLSGKLDEVTRLLDVLPGVLGAEGDRVYAVLAQNNVEIRSTGGLVGQCCRATMSNGLISLGDVQAIGHFVGTSGDEANCVPLTDEELNLYGNTVGYKAGNPNCIPDFPRVCDIFNQLWYKTSGEQVDGFIALDPIFLQMLMALTPGTQTSDGTVLDGTTTVRVLMHDTYWNHLDDYSATDAYFTEAASAVLDCIMGSVSAMDPAALLGTVQRGIDEGHLLMCSFDADEQEMIAGMGASGEVLLDPAAPQLGIYLNNSTWSKIEWYLNLDFSMGEAAENADGTKTYPCSLRLSNVMTPEELAAGNINIFGGNPAKRSDDDILDGFCLYAPAGGSIEVTSANEQFDRWDDGTYKGLQVVRGEVHNQIDAPAEISFNVTVSADTSQDLDVRITPTVQDCR